MPSVAKADNILYDKTKQFNIMHDTLKTETLLSLLNETKKEILTLEK